MPARRRRSGQACPRSFFQLPQCFETASPEPLCAQRTSGSKTKVNILFLCHRAPYPPNKGDKIRSFHELVHFSRSHRIHLLAFCDSPEELGYTDELREYCDEVGLILLRPYLQKAKAIVSMLKRESWTIGYYNDARMWQAVKRATDSTRFDVVFAYSSSMAPYALAVKDTPRVLDFVDSDAAKWRQYAKFKPAYSRWLYSYEASRLSNLENELIRSFDRSVFVSPREARHLTIPDGKVTFVQNGISLNGTSASPDREYPKAVFVGAMDYFPNIDAVRYFALEVLPLIRKSRDLEFLIVGSNPVPEVEDLARQPGVIVTGTVPDVMPYLKKASVAVVPTRIAQGIQNKILEALAAGLPVVATRAAAEGLDAPDGIPLRIADAPADFASRVLEYLEHPITLGQIANCREHLKQRFSWDINLSAFDQTFNQLKVSKT
jgi:sugar transferase (PEP-CTERM/EpsH1 system associated)